MPNRWHHMWNVTVHYSTECYQTQIHIQCKGHIAKALSVNQLLCYLTKNAIYSHISNYALALMLVVSQEFLVSLIIMVWCMFCGVNISCMPHEALLYSHTGLVEDMKTESALVAIVSKLNFPFISVRLSLNYVNKLNLWSVHMILNKV